jgi:hypothetical protein
MKSLDFLMSVQIVDQVLTHLKEGNFLCWNGNRDTGFGITSGTSIPFADTEAAEAAELNSFTPVERAHDTFENHVHNGGRFMAMNLYSLGYRFCQFDLTKQPGWCASAPFSSGFSIFMPDASLLVQPGQVKEENEHPVAKRAQSSSFDAA